MRSTVARVDLGDRFAGENGAGIVDERGDRAELAIDSFEHRNDLALGSHIGADRDRLAARRDDLSSDLFGLRAAACRNGPRPHRRRAPGRRRWPCRYRCLLRLPAQHPSKLLRFLALRPCLYQRSTSRIWASIICAGALGLARGNGFEDFLVMQKRIRHCLRRCARGDIALHARASRRSRGAWR